MKEDKASSTWTDKKIMLVASDCETVDNSRVNFKVIISFLFSVNCF